MASFAASYAEHYCAAPCWARRWDGQASSHVHSSTDFDYKFCEQPFCWAIVVASYELLWRSPSATGDAGAQLKFDGEANAGAAR